MTRTLPDHLAAERHLGGRAAWLRAAVLGANDGLISPSSLMIGVAAAQADTSATPASGVAGGTPAAPSSAGLRGRSGAARAFSGDCEFKRGWGRLPS